VVLAPMAGGPATVELAAAVATGGGLGFLAAGYLAPEAMTEQLAALREQTAGPVGVNVFCPPAAVAAPADVAAYARRLERERERTGVALGDPRSDDDGYATKLALLVAHPPEVVSFVFGCPSGADVDRLRAAGAEVWVTVTTPEEGARAEGAGADVLVAQGLEAGGHRGGFSDPDPDEQFGILALVELLTARTRTPVVAAGGIATAGAVRAVRDTGARAAQAGTAFLLCPEAGTAPAHRIALGEGRPTALTRAFTGRLARGLVNRFMTEHGSYAPRAYPEVHHLTSPLRRHGREHGDPEIVNLWAGQAHALAEALPAAEVLARLAE
jgi:nitronate monooxygenase